MSKIQIKCFGCEEDLGYYLQKGKSKVVQIRVYCWTCDKVKDFNCDTNKQLYDNAMIGMSRSLNIPLT